MKSRVPGLREVLFEFHQVGKHLRVNAIDPITGTEVTMICDPKVGQEQLKRLAMRKLIYVMERNAAKGKRPGGVDERA
ncbi:MAG: hypothetical protein VW405_09525 [Rhodospirillaceae bacterium]|jgi:hypothetical protein